MGQKITRSKEYKYRKALQNLVDDDADDDYDDDVEING
jgi:hypothetical protein